MTTPRSGSSSTLACSPCPGSSPSGSGATGSVRTGRKKKCSSSSRTITRQDSLTKTLPGISSKPPQTKGKTIYTLYLHAMSISHRFIFQAGILQCQGMGGPVREIRGQVRCPDHQAPRGLHPVAIQALLFVERYGREFMLRDETLLNSLNANMFDTFFDRLVPTATSWASSLPPSATPPFTWGSTTPCLNGSTPSTRWTGTTTSPPGDTPRPK